MSAGQRHTATYYISLTLFIEHKICCTRVTKQHVTGKTKWLVDSDPQNHWIAIQVYENQSRVQKSNPRRQIIVAYKL